MYAIYASVGGVIVGIALAHTWYMLPIHTPTAIPRTPRYTGVIVAHNKNTVTVESTVYDMHINRARVAITDSTKWFAVKKVDSEDGVRLKSLSQKIKAPAYIPPRTDVDVITSLGQDSAFVADYITVYDPS